MNMLMKHVHSERRIELDPRIGEYVYVVTTTAKTNAERQREFRARKATEQQATEVRGIFAHPDDHAPIKEHAAKLARKRAKSQAAAQSR